MRILPLTKEELDEAEAVVNNKDGRPGARPWYVLNSAERELLHAVIRQARGQEGD